LVNLLADPELARELKAQSRQWESWNLTPRQICDLELLLNGGFSPLEGFMGKDEYESVCASMSLKDGTLWPIPIILDVTEEFIRKAKPGSTVALREPEGVMLAVLHVDDIWKPDKELEAKRVYGSANEEHPGVKHLFQDTHS
jgi:sulfate adenylyltransferase